MRSIDIREGKVLIEQQFREYERNTNRAVGFASLGLLAVCVNTLLMLVIDYDSFVNQTNMMVFLPQCVFVAAFYFIARAYGFEGSWIKYMLMSGIVLMSVSFYFIFTVYASFYLIVPIVIACRYFNRRFIFQVSAVTVALFFLASFLNIVLDPVSDAMRVLHINSGYNAWTRFSDAVVFVVVPVGMVLIFVTSFSIKTSRLGRVLLKKLGESAFTMASVETELNTAALIQRSALPDTSYICPGEGFSIAAQEIPVKEVGGDFYDYFMAGEHSLAVLIADVSDKGVPAAMFMMSAKKAIRCAIQCCDDLTRSVELANRLICQDNKSDMFLTLWLGIIDTRSGVGKYINAGHIPPVLRHADGTVELIRNEPDLFLGNFPDMTPAVHTFRMTEGDVLFMYTDGVSDAMDPDGRSFGYDRVTEAVKSAGDSAKNSVEAVVRACSDFSRGREQFDDITMLALECTAREESERLSLSVRADREGTAAVIDGVDSLLRRHGCPDDRRRNAGVVADELCANLSSYAYPDGTGSILLEAEAGSNYVTMSFTDSGIEFDPLAHSDPEFSDEPAIGGLGIFFVKNLVDDISYRRLNGENRLQVTMIWNM